MSRVSPKARASNLAGILIKPARAVGRVVVRTPRPTGVQLENATAAGQSVAASIKSSGSDDATSLEQQLDLWARCGAKEKSPEERRAFTDAFIAEMRTP